MPGLAAQVVIPRKIDFGRSAGGKQGECGVDVRLIEVGDAEVVKPVPNDSAEEGGVEGFEGGGDVEATVGRDRFMGLDPRGRELLEKCVVTGRMGGEASQGRSDIAIEGLAKAGQDVMTKTVAAMGGGEIGRVLSEAEAVGGDVGVDVCATPREQGAMQDEAVGQVVLRFHAGDAGEACAAAGVGEDGFSLILGMMSEENMGCAMLFGGLFEKGVTGLTRSGFKGETPGFRDRGNVDFGYLCGETVLFGKAADKGGVLIGLFASEGVIQVAKDEVVVTFREQPMEQGDGITSAGDANEELQVFGFKIQAVNGGARELLDRGFKVRRGD
jgi:hypothetical protein